MAEGYILGSGRTTGGIPEPDKDESGSPILPDDYGTVELGSGRDAIYRKAEGIDVPQPLGSVEPVPADPEPAVKEPEPEISEDAAQKAYTMAKQPDANLSTAEHEKSVGWWENAGRGMLNRLGDDLLANLSEFGEKTADRVVNALPEGAREAAEYTPMIAGTRAAAGYLGEAAKAVGGRDYRVRGDWESVEGDWAKLRDSDEITYDDVKAAAGSTGEFMLETGIVSTPDMLAMGAALPAYVASRVEELATDRAKNQGRSEPTAEDYAYGTVTATIVTAIDKASLGFATKPIKKLLEKGFAPAIKRIFGATVVEAGQEAVQEGLEYAGTSVGTEAGATFEEGKRASIAGAVGGAGFGAGVSTASNVVGAFKSPADVAPTDTGVVDSGQVEVGKEGDDDYLPLAEEDAVTESDFVEPPPEPEVDPTKEPVPVAAEAEQQTTEVPQPKEELSDEEIATALKAAGIAEEGKNDTTQETSAGSGAGAGPATEGTPEQEASTPEASPTADATTESTTEPEKQPEVVAAKYTRGQAARVAALDLEESDWEGVETNAQGNRTKASVDQAEANKETRLRGELTGDVAKALDFIETNTPKSDKYTGGRTRGGKLNDKVGSVNALVTLVDMTVNKSSAPQAVKDRALEIAAGFRRLGSLSEEQMSGRGFTGTVAASKLDPAIDELVELVQALDQNRDAAEGTLGKSNPNLIEEAEAAQVVVEKAEAAPTPAEIAAFKAKQDTERKKLRTIKQGLRRKKMAKADRDAALAKVTATEAAVAAENAAFDKKANAQEKIAPTTKKTVVVKKGTKAPVFEGRREVTPQSTKGVKEAGDILTEMGVPEMVTSAATKVSDIPIDLNHYPLFVGLQRSLAKSEKSATNQTDRAAKNERKVLADTVKDVISTPDETAELAHKKAAGKLAVLGVHENVIQDVIDFAEHSRKVVQAAEADAYTTTETVKEISLEEAQAEQETDTQQTGEALTLDQQMDNALAEGDMDTYARLQEQSDTGTVDTGDMDAVQAFIEADTITLSDEYDTNEEQAGDDRQMDSELESKRDWADRVLSRLPVGRRGSKRLNKLHERQATKVGSRWQRQGGTTSAKDMLNDIVRELPSGHPYTRLAKVFLALTSDVQVSWEENLDGSHGRHHTSLWGKRSGAEITDYKIMLLNGMPPQFVMQTFLHEMVHNHTSLSTLLDNEFSQSLDQLRQDVLAALDQIGDEYENTTELKDKLYGLSNIDEFLAEALTNPRFQGILMGLKVRPDASLKVTSKRMRAWDRFVSIVHRILGGDPKSYSALDEVMRVVPSMFHSMNEDRIGHEIAPNNQTKNASLTTFQLRNGILARVKDGEYVAAWEIGKQTMVNNMVGELGPEYKDQAITSYNMMRGDDPHMQEALKNGSDADIESVVQRMGRGVKNQKQLSQMREWAGSFSLSMMTFDQIVRAHKEKFDSAKGNMLEAYEKVMRHKNRVAARWQARGAAIDEQWAKIEKAGHVKRFTEFVQDVTIAEIHPDISWDKQKHLYSKKELDATEALHKRLSDQFRKELTLVERETFIASRKFFTAQRKQLKNTMLNHIARTYITDPTLAAEVYAAVKAAGSVEGARKANAQVDAALDAAPKLVEPLERILNTGKLRGAYFPLRRYGKYVVSYYKHRDLGTFNSKNVAQAVINDWVKEHPSNKKFKPKETADGRWVADAKEHTVEFFESPGEGNAAIADRRKRGYTVDQTEATLKEDWAGHADVGASKVVFEAMDKFPVDDSMSKAMQKRNEAIRTALHTAFIEMLADGNLRKSNLQRQGTRGASVDGRRVFAERVFAGSYALADSETMFDQNLALKGMWDVARAGAKGALKAGQVARELTLRESHNINDRRSNRFNDWVGSLGFLGFLAGPSYPIINASQPWMVGLPWLGARYGVGATGAMVKNFSTFGPAVMKELIDSKMGLGRDPHQAIQNVIKKLETSGAAKGQVDMIRAMRDAGIMDSTFIDAVSEAAKAGGWNISKTGLFKFAASAPKIVEVLNRTLMATTAYQLEMKKSGDQAAAVEVAKEAILQTQFDYSDFNKPAFFKTPVLRPLLLFKMYPQGIYGMMAAAVKQAAGNDKEGRRIGRNTLLGITASHSVMGGVLGGVFMEPVRMLLSLVEMLYPFDDDDEENMPFWDKQAFDNNMRRIAVDLLGDEWGAELLLRGIPRAFGLDLSGRIGLHNLMFMGIADDGTNKNMVSKTVEQIGGAPLAVMLSWERAYGYFQNGDMQRAAEAASPKAIRDVLNAQRMSSRGLETFSGSRYMQPEEFDGFQHFVKMLGFSPAKTAELQEERWAQMSYDKKMSNRKSAMVNRWMRKDASYDDVAKWNTKHPDFRITPADVIRKQQGQMRDEMLDYKGYPINLRKPSVSNRARF